MFILLRRIERWLHQHIFKVGWLTTQNYKTTTILYYTFFLPGVILHELVYWLAAGVFNVKAEQEIKWPEEQEVAELKLNFVKISRAGVFRKAMITSTPLLIGLICIWLIANNIFDITSVLATMQTGELTDVVAGFDLLISAPLFWLWVYIIFTIANTMFPTIPKDLKGWRSVLIWSGVLILALTVLGLSGAIFEAVQAPISNLISVLQATFVLIILVDIIMVLILGTIEYTIERVTGNSATFRGKRMITMTREEAIAEREKVRERERKQREKRRKEAADSDLSSIYMLPFSIPNAPSATTITQIREAEAIEAEIEVSEAAEVSEKPISMPRFGGAAAKPEISEGDKEQREAIAARINLPSREPLVSETEDDEQELTSTEARSRFGVKPYSPPSSDDDNISDETDDEAKNKSIHLPKVSSPTSPVPKSKEDNEEKVVAEAPRFGVKPYSPPSSDDSNANKEASGTDLKEDNEEKVVAKTPSRFGIKPFGQEKEVEEDKETDKPAATREASRFGTSRFSASSKPISINDDSEAAEAKDDESVRIVGRPATPSIFEDDDDDEALDESIARRGRGDDSVSGLFGSLDDDDESVGSSVLFSRPSKGSGNRFDAMLDDDTEDEDSNFSLSRFQAKKPSQTRFGSRRPAPKPIISQADDVLDDEELVYEDIDEYEYEDDEDYFDYDDEE